MVWCEVLIGLPPRPRWGGCALIYRRRRLQRSRLRPRRRIFRHLCDGDREAAAKGQALGFGFGPCHLLLLAPIARARRGTVNRSRPLGGLLRHVQQPEAVGERVDARALFEDRGVRRPRAGTRVCRHARLFFVLPAVQRLVARVVDAEVTPPAPRWGRGRGRSIRVCGQRTAARPAA